MATVLQLEPFADLTALVGGDTLVSLSASENGSSLVALTLSTVADYREVGGSFAKLKTENPHDFKVHTVRDGEASVVAIPRQTWNFHFAQPLPDDHWLLVCGRCRRYADGSSDKNALVFDGDGRLKTEFLLGDGIQDVQTTGTGEVWVSYFDEGIFGNFGWNDPVGAPGLICWDRDGERVYEYSPSGAAAGFDTMADCYALNVASDDEAWVSYYTDFPLVRIKGHQVTGAWKQPVGGTHAFAVGKDRVLFQRGYQQADRFSVCEFQRRRESLKVVSTFFVADESGTQLPRVPCQGRGPYLFLFHGPKVYRVDVRAKLP